MNVNASVLRLVRLTLTLTIPWILLTVAGRGQAGEETIQPTVTAEMGDRGGRFFGVMPPTNHLHRHFIAAEVEMWDYAPQNKDVVCGRAIPPSVLRGTRVRKVRYVEYEDASFKKKVAPTPRLGVMGPVLRGVVGDYLAVTFWNRTDQPLSMHPHGVRYDKDNEGAYYAPSPGLGSAVGPGATFTYVWKMDEASGPLPSEPSSKAWLYHSHVGGDDEINLGLVGLIVVTDPKRARRDGTPEDVDREMAALFMIFHEEENDPPSSKGPKGWVEERERREEGSRHAINGYVFGNLPGMEMNQGERVRWYLIGLGSEEDLHTAHWHGVRALEDNRRHTDVVELLPASMKVADTLADNPGRWLFHCHVADHMAEGMFAEYVIHPHATPDADSKPGVAFLGYNHR